MKKLLLILVVCLSACSTQETDIEKKYVVEKLSEKQADDEELLNKMELIQRLQSAGLQVEIRVAKRTPKKLERAFNTKPKDHFIMSLEQEAFWVSRFKTIGQAKYVDAEFEDGFRFSNWHFAGQISVETTNLIKQALEKRTQDE